MFLALKPMSIVLVVVAVNSVKMSHWYRLFTYLLRPYLSVSSHSLVVIMLPGDFMSVCSFLGRDDLVLSLRIYSTTVLNSTVVSLHATT